MFLFTSVVFYAIVLQLVHALPFVKRIVVSPPITSPNADTVWTPGKSELVTWDTSSVPPTGNYSGLLVLGHQSAGSENLDLDHPLATGFSLRDGSVRVTCPTTAPGSNYIVVLLGDSGNASPQFTISGTSVSDSSGSTTSPNLVASPSAQPSSASTTSTTSVSSSLMTPASASGSSASASTTSTLPNVLQAQSSPPGHTTLTTSSESSSPSASAASISPVSGLNSNNGIPRIQNPRVMIAGAVVSVFTIFLV